MYPDQSKCVELFQNCREIIPISGKIVLCECVCYRESVVLMFATIVVREHSCLIYASMMLFGVEARTMDELIAVLDAAVLESVNLL